MSALFDARQVRRAFSRSAASYDAVAQLQRLAEARLIESLDYLDDPALARKPPQRVLDLGSGTGHASALLQQRWPKAEILSLDLALPMLRQARAASKPSPRWLPNPFARAPVQVCADARQLPLADGSVDVLFSNLCLQWVEDLDGVLNGFRRVLKPQGLLLFSRKPCGNSAARARRRTPPRTSVRSWIPRASAMRSSTPASSSRWWIATRRSPCIRTCRR